MKIQDRKIILMTKLVSIDYQKLLAVDINYFMWPNYVCTNRFFQNTSLFLIN